MSIVSNSSPLVSLARIGRLDLLSQLYGELTIPEAVWQEVVVEGAGQERTGGKRKKQTGRRGEEQHRHFDRFEWEMNSPLETRKRRPMAYGYCDRGPYG